MHGKLMSYSSHIEKRVKQRILAVLVVLVTLVTGCARGAVSGAAGLKSAEASNARLSQETI